MSQERSRARREQILDAAFHAFADLGYRETAVDEIARQSSTSKGGVYFHFPNKEAIFRELMRTTGDRLVTKVETAVAAESDPIDRADVAIRTVLETFAGHRSMARLLLVDAIAAGRVFQAEIDRLHERFAGLITGYLDSAVADGVIGPIDTVIAGQAWFGALDEIVRRWLTAEKPGPLQYAYPTLQLVLLRGVGVSEERLRGLAGAGEREAP